MKVPIRPNSSKMAVKKKPFSDGALIGKPNMGSKVILLKSNNEGIPYPMPQ